MQKYTSLPMTKLDDRPTRHDQGQAPPRRRGNHFLENKLSNQNTDDRKEGDINTDQLREIPFDRVDDQAVTTQRNKSNNDESHIAPPQTAANCRITANLQERRCQKYQPRNNIHVVRISPLVPIVVPEPEKQENLDSQWNNGDKYKMAHQ